MSLPNAIKRATATCLGAMIPTLPLTAFADDSVYIRECECIPNSTGIRKIPVTVRDFKRTHPDFESTQGEDYDIVTEDLGPDNLPVYAGNRSTRTTTNAHYFNKWYRDVPGVNITIPMTLELTEISPGFWQYSNQRFFPIDGMGWSTGIVPPNVLDDIYPINWWDPTTDDNVATMTYPETFDPDDALDPRSGHNFHFTLETHLQFDYNGGEEFTFVGDDDLFVYINRKLAINLGGVHSAIRRHIKLDDMADYLGIEPGGRYSFDLFFAERHTTQSNFKFQTTINLECYE